MRDFRKFCRPRTVKHPKFGDVQIKLKCGEIINVAVKEYKKLVRFFKLDSVVGTSPNSPGNVIVYDSDLGQDIIISSETYDQNKTKFESYKIVGDKLNTTNGHDYVEHNGVKWATMNVGAENENQLGYLFHWGDPRICQPSDAGFTPNLNYKFMNYVPNSAPGDTLKYNSTDGKTVLEPEDDIATQFWGENWRMPTAAEVISLTQMPTHTIQTVVDLGGGRYVLAIGDASTSTHIVNITHYQGIWTWTSEKTPGYGGYNAIVGQPGSSTNAPVFNCNPVRPVFDPKVGELPTEGDIVCYNSKLDKTSIFSFEDWLEVGDDWDLVGIYGIDTYEEEDTLNGDYVIMSNGNTLIIDSSDYTKLDDNWEHIDTITDAYTAVDLGLPSGTKWASKNVGARNVTNYGGYYMYGKGSTQYVYGDAVYSGTEIPLSSSADTAYQEMGTEWNTPTKDQLDELVANTTYSWQINFNGSGINGGKFTASNGNYIFIPASGYKQSSQLGGDGAAGYIQSSIRYDSSNTYRLFFNNTGCTVRYYDINAGYSVRGVITPPPSPHEYIDLGLPSGTLWAKTNVGATSETEYGNYYMYGKSIMQYNSSDSPYLDTEDPLDLSVDTARKVWGGSWHMPTKAQMEELIANTTYQFVTNYKGSGMNGGTFTATNGAVLFIPAAGRWSNGSQGNVGVSGSCWGSSPNGSGNAYYLNFNSGGEVVSSYSRLYGFSVRAVLG